MINLKDMLTKIGETDIRISEANKGRGTTVFLKGMDAVATKAEVEEAVRAETGQGPIKMGELRPYYGSSQAVTLTMTNEAAEMLTRKKGVIVGYNWCRATERIQVTQCFKCWRSGHTAKKCTNKEDRSKECRNCGEAGHIKAKCKNGKKCPLCNKEGHRAGEGACPVMRKALKDARIDRGRRPEEKEKRQEEEERNEEKMDVRTEEEEDDERGRKKYSPTTEYLRSLISS